MVKHGNNRQYTPRHSSLDRVGSIDILLYHYLLVTYKPEDSSVRGKLLLQHLQNIKDSFRFKKLGFSEVLPILEMAVAVENNTN